MILEFVKAYKLSLNSILAFLGYGYRARIRALTTPYFKLSTRLRVILVWLSHPSSPLSSHSYLTWLTQLSWNAQHIIGKDSYLWDRILSNLLIKVNKKIEEVFRTYEKYIISLNTTFDPYDKNAPIELSMQTSSIGTSEGYSKKYPVG
jgi:hypothetical protein